MGSKKCQEYVYHSTYHHLMAKTWRRGQYIARQTNMVLRKWHVGGVAFSKTDSQKCDRSHLHGCQCQCHGAKIAVRPIPTCVTSYRTRAYARTQPLRGHSAFCMKCCVGKVDHLCLMRDYILLVWLQGKAETSCRPLAQARDIRRKKVNESRKWYSHPATHYAGQICSYALMVIFGNLLYALGSWAGKHRE